MNTTPGELLTNWTPAQIRDGVHELLATLLPQYGFDQVNPLVPLAQAEHETGSFTSDLLLRADNAFGMRYPTVRRTVAIASDNGYAVYDSLSDCVSDYLERQRAFHIPNTSDANAYIDATVASGYAEDPMYAQDWKYIANAALGNDGTQEAGISPLLAIAAAALLLSNRHAA